MENISNPLNLNNSTAVFTLFPALPPEIRLKIWHLALSTPCIIPIQLRSSPPLHLTPIARLLPLFHTNCESRTCVLEKHYCYSSPTLEVPSVLMNTEIDYLFFPNMKTFELAYGLKDKDAMNKKIRRLAMPLSTWEALLNSRDEEPVIRLLSSFPKLEEIVLVGGDFNDELLKCGDLEFVMPKDVPKSPVLMSLAIEIFQPWRALEHLFGVEMAEDGVGRWVEGICRRRVEARHEGRSDMDGEQTAPKFKIREVRSAGETAD